MRLGHALLRVEDRGIFRSALVFLGYCGLRREIDSIMALQRWGRVIQNDNRFIHALPPAFAVLHLKDSLSQETFLWLHWHN
jgi:hypothetical protein